MNRRNITTAMSLLLTLVAPATADLYQAVFRGEIDSVHEVGTVTGINVLDPFTVTYLFNTNASDQDSDIDRGLFEVLSLGFEVGSVFGTGLPTRTHGVVNDEPGGPNGTQDRYSVAATTVIGGGGELLLDLRDFFATAFSDDSAPTSLNLSAFDQRDFILARPAGEGPSYEILGTIDTVTFEPSSVPAPGAALLGVVGLSLISIVRRRA